MPQRQPSAGSLAQAWIPKIPSMPETRHLFLKTSQPSPVKKNSCLAGPLESRQICAAAVKRIFHANPSRRFFHCIIFKNPCKQKTGDSPPVFAIPPGTDKISDNWFPAHSIKLDDPGTAGAPRSAAGQLLHQKRRPAAFCKTALRS